MPTATQDAQRHTVAVLSAAQVLGGVGVACGIAVSGLLAESVLGSATLAGLAQTASAIGTALAAVPLARLSDRSGRRLGLAAGYVAGALGTVVAILAAATGSFPLLIAGMVLFGGANAASLQSRYGAADLATPALRARAISTVVWATTVGAVAGPNLAGAADDAGRALGLPPFAGPFLLGLLVFGAAAANLLLRLRPDPLLLARSALGPAALPGSAVRRSLGSAWRVVAGRPSALLGLAALGAAQTVMVAVMVMSPLHLGHGGASLTVVGVVISVHVAGMFALAPAVGALADRLGRVAVLRLGLALLLGACLLAGLSGERDTVLLTGGLFLLGLGWSCGLVAGSALLTESVPAEERPNVQGAADLVTGLLGGMGGLVAGVVVAGPGFGALNVLGAAVVLPVLVFALRARVGGPPGAPRPAT